MIASPLDWQKLNVLVCAAGHSKRFREIQRYLILKTKNAEEWALHQRFFNQVSCGRWITKNLAGRKDEFANIELVLLVVLNSGVTAVGFPCISARIQGSHQERIDLSLKDREEVYSQISSLFAKRARIWEHLRIR